MKATISWWNLDRSSQTIESLRRYLQDEGVEPWEALQGMHAKAWISDPANNLWGAVVLWQDAQAMKQPLPPNRAMELIGYAPGVRYTFNVESLVQNQQIVHWFGGRDAPQGI